MRTPKKLPKSNLPEWFKDKLSEPGSPPVSKPKPNPNVYKTLDQVYKDRNK